MVYDRADEVIEEISESLLNRYQIWLETTMKFSDFIVDCVIYSCIINVII